MCKFPSVHKMLKLPFNTLLVLRVYEFETYFFFHLLAMRKKNYKYIFNDLKKYIKFFILHNEKLYSIFLLVQFSFSFIFYIRFYWFLYIE